MNRTYLSKIEKGATWVGLEIIVKLAGAVLEVEPAELLRLSPRGAPPLKVLIASVARGTAGLHAGSNERPRTPCWTIAPG